MVLRLGAEETSMPRLTGLAIAAAFAVIALPALANGPTPGGSSSRTPSTSSTAASTSTATSTSSTASTSTRTADRPISYNGLIGDAIIRDFTGASSAYNGIPIQGVERMRSTFLQRYFHPGRAGLPTKNPVRR
jgi:hypothetical protein